MFLCAECVWGSKLLTHCDSFDPCEPSWHFVDEEAAFCWWEVRWLNYDYLEGATTRNPGEEGVNFREEKDPPLAVCTSSSSPSWKYLMGLNRIFSLVLWAFALQFPLPTLPFTALFLWWNFSLLWEDSSHVLALVGPLAPPPPLLEPLPGALQAGSSLTVVHEVYVSPRPASLQAALTEDRLNLFGLSRAQYRAWRICLLNKCRQKTNIFLSHVNASVSELVPFYPSKSSPEDYVKLSWEPQKCSFLWLVFCTISLGTILFFF